MTCCRCQMPVVPASGCQMPVVPALVPVPPNLIEVTYRCLKCEAEMSRLVKRDPLVICGLVAAVCGGTN